MSTNEEKAKKLYGNLQTEPSVAKKIVKVTQQPVPLKKKTIAPKGTTSKGGLAERMYGKK